MRWHQQETPMKTANTTVLVYIRVLYCTMEVDYNNVRTNRHFYVMLIYMIQTEIKMYKIFRLIKLLAAKPLMFLRLLKKWSDIRNIIVLRSYLGGCVLYKMFFDLSWTVHFISYYVTLKIRSRSPYIRLRSPLIYKATNKALP